MSFQSVVYLHEQGWTALSAWWVVLIFAWLMEIAILLQSKRLTRRTALEMGVSTLVPFLLFFWALTLMRDPSAQVSATALDSPVIPLMLGGLLGIVRGIGGALVFPSGFLWGILGSLPVPLFVYFTSWVTIK